MGVKAHNRLPLSHSLEKKANLKLLIMFDQDFFRF